MYKKASIIAKSLIVATSITILSACVDEKLIEEKVKQEVMADLRSNPENPFVKNGRLSYKFPDFGFMVPANSLPDHGNIPLFRIKTDYPMAKPSADLKPAFMKIDFKIESSKYLDAFKAYAFEGNLPDWNPHKNEVREWFHIPWLHPNSDTGFPPNGGTEGFHGLIKEAPVSPLQLGPTQKGSYQVYAVTLINEIAAYTMAQMWKNPTMADPEATDKRYGGGFLEGAVFAKLLFTDAPEGTDYIDFLENPLTWDAYVTETWESPKRVKKTLNLLQMDVMVRDHRVDSTTGWVLGTFAYNGQLNKPNKFDNLVPIGMIWGNDPQITANKTNPFPPTKTIVNDKLKETIILDSPNLPPQHLGWNSRLNGPADLNTSSCMSCHMMAQYPALTAIVPAGSVPDGGPNPPAQGGDQTWMQWFQNIKAATPQNPAAYSTDFSLQVVISLQNFFATQGKAQAGIYANEYNGNGKHPVTRSGK